MFNDYDDDDKYVESDDACSVKRVTDRALLVEIPGAVKAHWVPRSQIHDDSEVYEDDTSGTLIVTRWWAKQEGLL